MYTHILFSDRVIHRGGFTEEERMTYRQLIHSNTIQCITDVLATLKEQGRDLSTTDLKVIHRSFLISHLLSSFSPSFLCSILYLSLFYPSVFTSFLSQFLPSLILSFMPFLLSFFHSSFLPLTHCLISLKYD